MGDVTDDKRLIDRILEGDTGAAQAFRDTYSPLVRRRLLGRCSDPRSRSRAEEIASDVIADCFGASGKKPLLEIYSGQAPLEHWLNTVAVNRLKNWWRSGRWRYEKPQGYMAGRDSDSTVDVIESAAGEPEMEEDPEVAALLSEALLAAFQEVPSRDLVFLRLVHLFGIKRIQLAAAWGIDNATVGRRMENGAGIIRRATLAYLERLDPDLDISWDDCLAICARHPQVLLGEAIDDAEDVVEGTGE